MKKWLCFTMVIILALGAWANLQNKPSIKKRTKVSLIIGDTIWLEGDTVQKVLIGERYKPEAFFASVKWLWQHRRSCQIATEIEHDLNTGKEYCCGAEVLAYLVIDMQYVAEHKANLPLAYGALILSSNSYNYVVFPIVKINNCYIIISDFEN